MLAGLLAPPALALGRYKPTFLRIKLTFLNLNHVCGGKTGSVYYRHGWWATTIPCGVMSATGFFVLPAMQVSRALARHVCMVAFRG